MPCTPYCGSGAPNHRQSELGVKETDSNNGYCLVHQLRYLMAPRRTTLYELSGGWRTIDNWQWQMQSQINPLSTFRYQDLFSDVEKPSSFWC